MASAVSFPDELCVTPMPFVVLTGLDVTYNAVHKSIWDAFSNNRRHDRLNLSFACLEGDHQYPAAKAKRMSYDWYIPKGLLKTEWMKKHLQKVPSVVVVFFELDWDDLAWRERHLACASRVEVVRTSLQKRTTKVAVVLIQKSSPLPPGEDMVAAERAAALCSACNLSAKSLFVLPHTDHLIGYIIRLENAFYELAQSYYHTECRRVKAHKEFLNKTTHQLLFPRHQFKVAFFCEMMEDPASALRHYQQSYSHIHELRLHDSNNLELKVVGGYVNYKICKLCFLKLNAPIDAITQFQRHIDLFKPLCGIEDLLFEHSAWLSKQFLVFGDLFCEAINAVGLTAVQTQHPGFYFQRAAYYAQVRKQLAQTICGPVVSNKYPMPDPLLCDKLEYFGQRPWRQGHQRIDLSDTTREKEGILSLQLKELEIDHSWQIIPLLSSAVSQFKKFHCPRLKRYLTIEMSKEYYYAHDFEKAITLLQRATTEYRNAQWSTVLTYLLVLLLDCAYLTTDIVKYFTFSAELLGRFSQLSSKHKNAIQKNILQILSGQSPQHLFISQIYEKSFNCARISVTENTDDNWKTALSGTVTPCEVEIGDLKSFIECKVIFAKPQFSIEKCIRVYLCIFVTCPQPFKITELSLSFNNSEYDKFCIIKQDEISSGETLQGSLCYEPMKVKVHEFEFPVGNEHTSKSLTVQTILMRVSSIGIDYHVPLIFTRKLSADRSINDHVLWNKEGLLKEMWSDIRERASTQVVKRESKLSVEFHHKAPALIGEVYPIKIHLHSHEDDGIVAENISLFASLKLADDVMYQRSTLSNDSNALQNNECIFKKVELICENLASNQEKDMIIYVKANDPGLLRLDFQISYEVQNIAILQDDGNQTKLITCSSFASSELTIDVVSPFNFTSHVASMSFESLSVVGFNEPFLVLTTFTSDCCWPIEIVSGHVSLSDPEKFQLLGDSANVNETLLKDESVMDCINVVCKHNPSSDSPIPVGAYVLHWRRLDDELKFHVVSTTLKLPLIGVKLAMFHVSAWLPAFGRLRKPAVIQYKIKNQTAESKQLEVSYSTADAFMFSGPKQTNNFIPPLSSLTISFSVIPLALGFQSLPKLKILLYSPNDGQGEIVLPKSEVDTSSLPTHLTIKPAEFVSM